MRFDFEPLSSIECYQLPRCFLSTSCSVSLVLVFLPLGVVVGLNQEAHNAGSGQLGGLASCVALSFHDAVILLALQLSHWNHWKLLVPSLLSLRW